MMMDRRDHFIQNTRIKSLFRNDGTKFFLYIKYWLCFWDALAHLIIFRTNYKHDAEQKFVGSETVAHRTHLPLERVLVSCLVQYTTEAN
jgi:hypothetical protein